MLLLLFCVSVPLAAQTPTQVTGTWHTTWIDPKDPREPALQVPTLAADDGRIYIVDVASSELERFGGGLGLAGRRVTVRLEGGPVPDFAAQTSGARPRLRVAAVEQVHGRPAFEADPLLAAATVGPEESATPYVTLLCRFPDIDWVPNEREHYASIMAASFPGVTHYWEHVSAGSISMAGSTTHGWYTLPRPSSEYVMPGNWASAELERDCMAAADGDVHFPDYAGINVQTNYDFGKSWASVTFSDLDGMTRLYRLTILSDWAGMGSYAHEIGHTFGLPHSSGPYSLVYDSHWDVMSRSSGFSHPGSPHWMGAHTIAYHRDRLGWIAPGRRFVAPPGTSTLVLAQDINGGGSHPQMVVIPLPDGAYYTLEARRQAGYDAGLPGDAVVIHHLARGRDARVVDADGNGITSDEGSAWRVGETFRDPASGTAVDIDAVLTDGIRVIVHAGAVASMTVSRQDPTRRDIPFGTAGVVRDSAEVRITGPGADGIRWSAMGSRSVELDIASGTGSGWVHWHTPADQLAAGVHARWVGITTSGGAAGTAEIADTLVVAPPPGIAAGFAELPGPDSLVVEQSRAGWAALLLGKLVITGPGAAAAPWSVARQPSWLTLHTTAGTGNAWLAADVSAAGLAPGEYVDTVRIDVTGAERPAILEHRLVVLAPLTLVPHADVLRATAPQETITTPDSVFVGVQGAWAADAALSIASTGHVQLDGYGIGHAGSSWIRFRRSTLGLAPGRHAAQITVSVQKDPDTRVVITDSIDVHAAPARLVVDRTSTRDTAWIGAWSESYVDVRPEGDGSATRPWQASTTSASVLLDWMRDDLFGGPVGPEPGPRRIRWSRNTTTRPVGLTVDTIRIAFADAPAQAVLVLDSVWLEGTRPPAVLTTNATTRAGVGTPGMADAPPDSVFIQINGAGQDTIAWTATATAPWLQLQATSGRGPAVLRWSRSAAGLGAGVYTDTIAISAPGATGSPARVADTFRVVGPVVIASSAARPPARVGTVYQDTLRATGGEGGYRWRLTGGTLPPGMALDSVNGIIAGTAGATGSYAFDAEVRSESLVATASFTLAVYPEGLVVLSDSVRPPAVMGAAYADTLRAFGAAGPERWTVTDGTLPPGIALDSLTGALGGIMEGAGTWHFTVQVRADDLAASRAFRLDAAKPLLQPLAVLDQLLGAGALTPNDVHFLDLLGNRNGRLDVGDVRAWLVDASHLTPAETAALRQVVGGIEREDETEDMP
ncbi:MAG TPA: putative Ig domain-containing protein [Longimicrobiales bacterium]|nr:putative Ig domain-containing protein [Longimicrobiales bacterium]